MAVLNVQVPAAAGSAVTLVPAGVAGDQWSATAGAMLVVDNAGASPLTVTFTCYRACDVGGILHPVVQTVGVAAREYFPPVAGAYVDPATGRAEVTYSATASVTVGVVAPIAV